MTAPRPTSRRAPGRGARSRRAGRHVRTGDGLLRRRGPVRRIAVAAVAVAAAVAGVAAVLPQDAPRAVASAEARTPSALWTAAFDSAAATVPAPVDAAGPVTLRAPAPDPVPPPVAGPAAPPPVPAGSGVGRRIVFSEGQQRVWLVSDAEAVERTYLVSGSRFDNLEPGTYAVGTRLRHATAFDGSGTMEYFVGFTTGWTAPIGFHTIPVYPDGTPEQTLAELGTPLSAGCVRQDLADAIALWEFAPAGTTVVVTA